MTFGSQFAGVHEQHALGAEGCFINIHLIFLCLFFGVQSGLFRFLYEISAYVSLLFHAC
jgi:hypothetical protein